MVTETSKEAFGDILNELGERQTRVLKALKKMGVANNRMLADALHLPINSVTPRIFELRQKNLVVEDKTEIDYITGKKTKFWRVNETNRTL